MAENTRLQRLLQILDLLQSGRWPKTRDLSEICGVTERTIYRDFQTLIDAGFQIEHDAYHQGYRLGVRTYLRPTELDVEETLALILMGIEASGSSSWLSRGGLVKSALLKLSSNLPSELLEYVHQIHDHTQVQRELGAELTQEAPAFDALRRSLTERKCLRIEYQSLTEQEQIHTRLSPYHVLFVRRSWYVIGYSTLHRGVRTFKIGRIQAWEMQDKAYTIPAKFTLQKFLRNAWQLIREPGPSQKLVNVYGLEAETLPNPANSKTKRP